MIDIRIKSTGTILDIAPDATFQIEYGNPMFEDDRFPVPFSTEISFLPTKTNKQEFGYLDAMLLPPSKKRLDAEIWASGVKILDGCLIYSSVKAGSINYTFAGKSVEDDWSTKIHEKSLYTLSGVQSEFREQLSLIRGNHAPGVYLPLLVNASETTEVVAPGGDNDRALDIVGISHVTHDVKYHNYPYSYAPVITPAISVTKILWDELQNVAIDQEDLNNILSKTVILGLYKTDNATTGTGIPADGMDLAKTLPDITSLELLKILSKMLCTALFRNGDSYSLVCLSEILWDNTDILNWDDKVSREAEISSVPAGGYKFAYANDEDENTYDNDNLQRDTESGEIKRVEHFSSLLSLFGEDYKTVMHEWTGSVISGKVSPGVSISTIIHADIPDLLLCDILSNRDSGYDIAPADADGDTYDNSVDAKLVRSIPDTLFSEEDLGDGDRHWMMAAVVNPVAIGEKRGSEVYIGRIEDVSGQHQIGDGTVYFDDDVEIQPASFFYGRSLRPQWLYLAFHKAFAQWCTSEHVSVSAQLALSMDDIASFRMWRKVSFAGRRWLVKKLTITFHAASGHADVEGEFVSVDKIDQKTVLTDPVPTERTIR